ncbi:cyclic nucleotide-binding domain-containing protein [Paraconexibacter antarcticus]|uniref:Cyclic nucleotide-binding domain-containing protein n=1 Tax=Paraconexibacter antarcticus TaxID=2949664 RepID=A0ABY5DWX4_9ACTN|nr:cyclic nucleotide-binding domain-containing protein [Paraconexibacter antarcticus]UTI66515.1 cyclic nucleotide-binding domain-containing protein [Paraconexibacter antarcticus]
MDANRLKNISVFADLGEDGLNLIAALASEVSVPAGKELVREGDYSYDILAIEEGTAKVERGGEHLADLKAGDIIGEMGVLEKAQRTATVTATSPMVLVTMDRWDVKRLAKQSPRVVDELKALIEQRRAHA